MSIEEENFENICRIVDSFNDLDYSSLESQLDGNLREPVLIAMARLNFERTFPRLKKRLNDLRDNSYKWQGHPIYYDPFILTMGVIIEDLIDKGTTQAMIDRFKPLTDAEKNFFDYTLRCLFYIEPNKKQNIVL